jgi:hypothetical protein
MVMLMVILLTVIYADCHFLLVILNVVMLNVIMLC